MSIVKVGWSGGKDSTCAVSLHLKQGDFVKAVCYIPMFTDEIPLLTKRHYNFILNTADLFKSQGAEIYFAKGITYWEYVTHVSLRGIHKGKIFGFPYFGVGKCGFKRDSKLKACNSVNCGNYDYESIGICFDEYLRHNQLNINKRSLLVEKEYTEAMCIKYCYDNSILSPHYEYTNRDGCVLCFNAKEIERQIWYNDYPNSKELLIELQDICKLKRPDSFPLRGYQWFIDTDNPQLSIFDLL